MGGKEADADCCYARVVKVELSAKAGNAWRSAARIERILADVTMLLSNPELRVSPLVLGISFEPTFAVD